MKKRILIVDDSPTVLMLHKMILQEEGYDVVSAKNGREALDVASRERPDAILLDLVMPGMDGLAALAALRARTETAKTPVVVVTTRSEERFATEAVAAGCDAYLLKPFERSDLSATLGALLGIGGDA